MHFNVAPVSRPLALALVAALWSGQAAPTRAAATAGLGQATFDANRSEVSVPYTGPAPRVTFYRLSPSHFYYEIQPARLSFGNVQFQAVGGSIERFTLANRPAPDVVRLSFQLSAGATPTMSVDAPHHRLIFLPLGHESAHPLARPGMPRGWQLQGERGAWAQITRPVLADAPRRLVLPFSGAPPRVVATSYQRNPRWVVIDLVGADVRREGSWSGAIADPLIEGWILARHPEPHHARLFLRLRQAASVRVQLAPNGHEIWFLPGEVAPPSPVPSVEPSPAPSPEPSAVTTPALPIRVPAMRSLPGSAAPAEPGASEPAPPVEPSPSAIP